ncbi:MAG: hypothetical protein M3Z30_00705 [Gemmatimonadota bacterium]|nr:hypothetical protein [Gemmatimonadota bacterium]
MNRKPDADVPATAHAKAVQALDEFDVLISQYETLLDTQQALVRTANFAGLFDMASRGDKLARDASNCGKRFTPLVAAVADGQFSGPRAVEIRRRSFAASSRAQTLDSGSARLAVACMIERENTGRELRQLGDSPSNAGLPPAYRRDPERFLDRRG